MDYASIFEELMHEKPICMERLIGGATNISFSVITQSGHYILRVPGKGTNEYINRSDEIKNVKAGSELGFIPPILYSDASTGIIISRYVKNNTPMSKNDISTPENLRLINCRLVQLHKSGISFENEFDIVKTSQNYKKILTSMQVELPDEFLQHVPLLEDQVDLLFREYPKDLVPCHGDPKLNNFLLADGKMWLIDWEYSGMCDKYFDLVNLVMTDKLSPEEERTYLQSYEECDGVSLIPKKYLLWKISTDYLWIYWHLIKYFQKEMVEYNDFSWRNRLRRALENIEKLKAL